MALRPRTKKRKTAEERSSVLDPIQRALQENEDWHQDLVQHSQDLLCIHDLQGRLLSINPSPARVLGYRVEELLQIPMREIIPPQYLPDFESYLSQIEREGHASGLMAVMTRSGELRIWEYHNTLRTEGVASPIVRGMAHDVTEQKRAEKLLREASERLRFQVRENERTIRELTLFRTLMDQSNDAIEVVDPETNRFLDVNEKACSDLGYGREELLSLRVSDIDPAITESSAAKAKEELSKSGCIVTQSLHRRKDGSTFPVEVSIKQVRLERNYFVVIVRDLTERKRAEALLQASENRYRTVHDLAPVGICRADTRTGQFLEVNPKYCEILGRSESDLLARNFQSVTHPDDVAGNLRKLRPLVEGEVRHYEIEKRYLRPDGSIRWVEVGAVAMWPEGGNPDWHMAIIHDITERRRAEERLREYERVVEGLDEMIAVVDREYRYVIANRAFLDRRGMKKEQVVGHRVDELLQRDVFDRIVKPKLDECFQGKVVEYGMKYKYPRLGERDLLLSYFPIEGPTGIDRIAAVVRDITERKQAEETLQRSEENYRMFVAQVSEGIFREDLDAPIPIDLPEDELVHHILHDSYMAECNDAQARMYGLTSGQEFVGKRLTDMLPPDDPHNLELTRHYIRSGFRVLDRESHEFDIHGNPKVFLNSMIGIVEHGMLVRTWGIQRDVTERVKLEEARRKAEEALQESEERYRSIITAMRDGIVLHDASGKIVTWNDSAERMLGWTRDMEGRTSMDRQIRTVHEDGSPFPGGTHPATVTLRTGQSMSNVVMGVYRPDDTLIWISINSEPLIHKGGEQPYAAVASFTDITERKQAEEALRQSEQRFRIALDGSPIKVFNQDRDLRYTWVYNPQEGWSEQDYLGKTDEDIFDPEVAARMTAMKRPVIETGQGVREQFPIVARGKTYYCDITVEPLRDTAGSVVGVNCACVDVTHLREITEELRLAKEKLSEEKLYLEQTIDTELGFGEIIGRSSALKEVMVKVAKVAPGASTVLLLGETGTGKELVARAIHRLSKRRDQSFIKMNCAAIPSGLLESELFGHEKGAFTGSVAKKLGRLELADHGTLFLDEIGEIPLELQPKLLRVLQDREFERLGGIQTLKVDFRLIAATNRDLRKDANQGQFRSDLYYRLNVFPIQIPPLRERREDIPLLIEHFLHKYASKMDKSILSVPTKTMEILTQWDWPGNIRELENFVERSVILTPGSVLRVPLGELGVEPA